MITDDKRIDDIDNYISSYPDLTQNILKKIRKTIKTLAPKATETISYGIPTFRLNGNLVHYAAYRNHIGFYPGASGIAEFKDEISAYKNAKGSVQFPLDKPMPYGLIKKIVRFRVKENMEEQV